MRPDEEIHTSLPPEKAFEPASSKRRGLGGFPAWLKVSGVVLLLVCLASGIFVGVFLQRHLSITNGTNHSGWCASTGDPLPANGSIGYGPLVVASSTNIWTLGLSIQSVSVSDSHSLQNISFTSFLQHWDGTQWNRAITADTTPLLNSLKAEDKSQYQGDGMTLFRGIATISANDIWAVGGFSIPSPNLKIGVIGHSLIEHWNGHQWQLVPSPDGVVQGNNFLSSLAVISASNIWAVGEMSAASTRSSVVSAPLVEHWDGKSWSLIHLPASIHGETLDSITATSANDIWATGTVTSDGPASDVPLVVHWDGQSWHAVTLPTAFHREILPSITATSAQDVWITGRSSSHTPFQPLLAHWDGQQWNLVKISNDVPEGSQLEGITANGAHDIWVVGSSSPDKSAHKQATATHPLIEHWNGQRWVRVTLPVSPYGEADSVVNADGKIWILGNGTDAQEQSFSPWIENMC